MHGPSRGRIVDLRFVSSAMAAGRQRMANFIINPNVQLGCAVLVTSTSSTLSPGQARRIVCGPLVRMRRRAVQPLVEALSPIQALSLSLFVSCCAM